jgi:hypothetical protein
VAELAVVLQRDAASDDDPAGGRILTELLEDLPGKWVQILRNARLRGHGATGNSSIIP